MKTKTTKEQAALSRIRGLMKASDPDAMTEEQRIEAYKQNNGIKCMFCWRDQLQGVAVEISSGQASQDITCPSCGASWTDVYTLSNAVNIEKGGA